MARSYEVASGSANNVIRLQLAGPDLDAAVEAGAWDFDVISTPPWIDVHEAEISSGRVPEVVVRFDVSEGRIGTLGFVQIALRGTGFGSD